MAGQKSEKPHIFSYKRAHWLSGITVSKYIYKHCITVSNDQETRLLVTQVPEFSNSVSFIKNKAGLIYLEFHFQISLLFNFRQKSCKDSTELCFLNFLPCQHTMSPWFICQNQEINIGKALLTKKLTLFILYHISFWFQNVTVYKYEGIWFIIFNIIFQGPSWGGWGIVDIYPYFGNMLWEKFWNGKHIHQELLCWRSRSKRPGW